jgi:hypothetical protein
MNYLLKISFFILLFSNLKLFGQNCILQSKELIDIEKVFIEDKNPNIILNSFGYHFDERYPFYFFCRHPFVEGEHVIRFYTINNINEGFQYKFSNLIHFGELLESFKEQLKPSEIYEKSAHYLKRISMTHRIFHGSFETENSIISLWQDDTLFSHSRYIEFIIEFHVKKHFNLQNK